MRKIFTGIALLGAGAGTYYYLSTATVEHVIPIRYPTNINPNDYWWDLQSTTNFHTWDTEQTNLGPGDVFVTNNVPEKFFRMRGRP